MTHVQYMGAGMIISLEINAGAIVLIAGWLATIWVSVTTWNFAIFVAKPAIIPIGVGLIVQCESGYLEPENLIDV